MADRDQSMTPSGPRRKGNRVVKDAAALLRRSGLRYVGMVEGNHLAAGAANVVVCDGFVGNVALKTTEGVGRELAAWLRADLAGALPDARLAELAARVVELTNPIARQGSLPLLGIRGPVVMAHGAADRHAIRAAIGQAAQAVRGDFVATLAAALAETSERLRGSVGTS